MKTGKKLWRMVMSALLAIMMLVSSVAGMITVSAEETGAASGITDKSVSLGEDIVVYFYTTATTDDGSVIKATFNGESYDITENVKGVFSFVSVTPQNLNDTITAQLYAKDGSKLGDEVSFSVQSYLEEILAFEYGAEGCKCGCTSKIQHTAITELCVNMLNYGAAAQEYVSHDVENLANKNLTEEQKAYATSPITVTESDKAVVGEAWVGAGVRFDYKLGLYFVFEATAADEYEAYINGNKVEAEAYPAAGNNCYVIRYSGFNATNMNSVVTAKLTKGETEQTFAYSVKSYVAAKGGDDSAIAKLVNATYVYGYAAVAYSAQYVKVEPTFEAEGSISMDGKGYDFSQSKYAGITLPVLSAANYDTKTTNSGTEAAPVVATEYILKHDTWAYTRKFDAEDCINVDGTLASKYDCQKLNKESLTVTYDAAKGYTVTATNATLATLATYGAELTIKGTLTMDLTTPEGATVAPTWTLYKKTTLGDGTEDGKATVKVLNAAGNGVVLSGADMLVAKNSSLTDNVMSLGTNTLTVDGTVTATKKIGTGNLLKADSNYETGYKVSIYIRSGKLTTGTIITNSMQIGSLMNGNVTKGHLVLTGPAAGEDSTLIGHQNRMANKGHFFLAGQIDASAASNSRLLNIKAPGNTQYSCRIDVRKNMVINLGNNIEGFVYTHQNSNADSYNVFWEEGAKLNKVDAQGTVTGQCENFFRVYEQDFFVYSWKEAEVLLGTDATETTKVLIANRQLHTTAYKAYVKTSTAIVIPAVTKDTVITDTLTDAGATTTVNTAVLGTLTKATYTDGNGTTQTVYYRVISK